MAHRRADRRGVHSVSRGWAVALVSLAVIHVGAAPRKEKEVPEGTVFELKSKWSGSFVSGNREDTHAAEATVRKSSSDSVTLRMTTGEHGSRDWKFGVAGKRLTLVSCSAATASAGATVIKDVKISGEFQVDENGAAKELMVNGEWVFQSKRAGGTERVKLVLKRAK